MRTGGPLLAALTALAPLAPVSGCNCGMPEGDYFGTVAEHPEPGHLRYCNAGEPQYLDPALSTSTSDLKPVYALWDGLTRHNLDGLPEPSIATRWDISDDQRIFTFHLRSDARWSTGRPITAYDFRYHIVRILHPLTASSNTDPHWKLKNGKDFTANTVRMILRASGPFKSGDVVVMTDAEDDKQTAARTELLSYTNRFRADVDVELRDLPGAPETLGPEPYYTVDAGDEVTLIERAPGPGGELWAYVHRASGDGVYGWVPAKLLTRQEHMEETVPMHAVSRTRVPGLQISREEFAAIKKAEEDTEHPVKPVTAQVKVTDMMMLPEVLGLQTPDAHTLVLETENPTPFIIDMSPQRAYRPTPREAVSRWPQKWSRPEHIITSGPFHLTGWRIRDAMEMVKSPTYWDAAHVRLDRITFYAIDDQAATANYYYYGGCDAIHSNNVPASYLPILTGERRGGQKFTDFYTAPFLGIYFYLINTEKVSNRHFRRALGLAIDRRPIPQFIHGGERPASQMMPGVGLEKLSPEDQALCGVRPATAPPGGRADCPAWFEETAGGGPFCAEDRVASVMIPGKLCYLPPGGLGFDADAARAELELARKEMGGKFPRTVTVKFNSGAEGHKLIAEYVQNEWKRVLGIDVQLEIQEWKTFLADTKAGEYEVARFGSILNFPDVEAEMLPQFECGAPDNRTKWCNQDFMRLYHKAQATFDRKQRVALLRECERVLLEDQPVIPLYVYTLKHLQKPYVRDLARNFTDQVPFEKAWIDPDWAP